MADNYDQPEPIEESELNNRGCSYRPCPNPALCRRVYWCDKCFPTDWRDVEHDHLDRNGRYQECHCFSCHCPPNKRQNPRHQ